MQFYTIKIKESIRTSLKRESLGKTFSIGGVCLVWTPARSERLHTTAQNDTKNPLDESMFPMYTNVCMNKRTVRT